MKTIRVLHILQRMEAAGIQTFLMNIYRVIDREKIQFDFLVHYKESQFYDDEILKMGGRIYKLSVREDFNIIKYKKELRRFFREHNEYQVVHGHMETLSEIWEKEVKRAHIPTIIVHSHTAGFNEKNFIKLAAKEYFRKSYGKYAGKWLACSYAAGEFMFPDKNYEVIPNAVEVNKFKFSGDKRKIREAIGIGNDFVIGHVGRFHPLKNHMFIIDIAEKLHLILPGAKVILVGDGELRGQIESEIIKRGLENVVMLMGNRQDVSLLYSAMDAFIMPSLYEGLPLSGVEAQAAGLRCFFSDTITKEIKITELSEFLSLESGAESWAFKIAEASQEKRERERYADLVAQRGYDIMTLSNRLTSIYLSACEEGCYASD